MKSVVTGLMSTMSRSCSRDIGSCQSVWNGDGWRAAGYQLEDENLKSEQFVSAFEVSQQWHVGGMAFVSLHCSRANHNRGYHPLLNNTRFFSFPLQYDGNCRVPGKHKWAKKVLMPFVSPYVSFLGLL